MDNINILPLLEKSDLSAKMKNSISQKLNNIISTIEDAHNKKDVNIDIDLLAQEIKATAKILVKKSDKFQKDIISSTLKQKEESLETLEISKLRIQAQMKDLKKKENALTIKPSNSFFTNLKINLSKLLGFNNKAKYSQRPASLQKTLNDYNKKLSNYDLEKNKISQNYYENGSKKLELIRKNTFKILCTSKYNFSNEAISSFRERIKNL